jgi:hypothetical protein
MLLLTINLRHVIVLLLFKLKLDNLQFYIEKNQPMDKIYKDLFKTIITISKIYEYIF